MLISLIPWLGLSGFERIATRRSPGTVSLSSEFLPVYFQTRIACQARNVSARTCEAHDEPGGNRIGNKNHNDGCCPGGVLCCRNSRRVLRNDDVRLELDEVGSEVRQPIQLAVPKSKLDDNVLALSPTKFTQSFPKGIDQGRCISSGPGPKKPDPPHFGCSLRLDCTRPSEEHPTRASKERATVHYWITSSARASSDGGMVRPSALAVLRLMTNSNFVGCSMGRSAAFAPLKSLST